MGFDVVASGVVAGCDAVDFVVDSGVMGFGVVGTGIVGFGVVGFGVVGFGEVGCGVVGCDVVGSGVVGCGVVGCGVVGGMQTFKPSAQVCSIFAPTGPHFPRHDPPLPQQVGPSLLGTQLGHSEKRRTFFL